MNSYFFFLIEMTPVKYIIKYSKIFNPNQYAEHIQNITQYPEVSLTHDFTEIEKVPIRHWKSILQGYLVTINSTKIVDVTILCTLAQKQYAYIFHCFPNLSQQSIKFIIVDNR